MDDDHWTKSTLIDASIQYGKKVKTKMIFPLDCVNGSLILSPRHGFKARVSAYRPTVIVRTTWNKNRNFCAHKTNKTEWQRTEVENGFSGSRGYYNNWSVSRHYAPNRAIFSTFFKQPFR